MADRGSAVEGSSYSNFAGIFLFVVGLFNILDGVIMLWRKEYFQEADLVVSNLQTWGWAMLVIGVVQVLARLAGPESQLGRPLGRHHHRRRQHDGVVRGHWRVSVLDLRHPGDRRDGALGPDGSLGRLSGPKVR